jgi:hypothetical protein
VRECPAKYSNVSYSCVIADDSMNKTEVVTEAEILMPFPIPFTITSTLIVLCILCSKLQFPHTMISVSIYGSLIIISIVCNIYYLINGITKDLSVINSQNVYLIVLAVASLLNYVTNITYLFIKKQTIEKDE